MNKSIRKVKDQIAFGTHKAEKKRSFEKQIENMRNRQKTYFGENTAVSITTMTI